ncbi:uncharacterized protein LOC107270989 [Cephus cinctus]|uniref:Uncharacterized protein LOC107270989 n=1 Tax=Cephus cinctus TaxID=211228 RepID=A0AAJ7C4V6_CEPCN|nr:uncharacterized protein LOC107270989 [Cephus cinctus]
MKISANTWCVLLGVLLVFCTVHADKVGSAADCLLQENSLFCLKEKVSIELDKIETEVSGRKNEIPISKVIEEAGSLVSDGVQVALGVDDATDDFIEDSEEQQEETRGIEEARKKKFGKKKAKKGLQKVLMVAMLIKSKLSLLLQLISTHLQVKFFVLAVISLLLNLARFWIDLKKTHSPNKVIYYEHAQHQHHYDHEDDHGGYWGRASIESPDDLAYKAHIPEH